MASTAAGMQTAGFTACKAMTVAVRALKELKLLSRKKSQIYSLQWKLKGKKKMALLSPLMPNLGREKSYTFSRILIVPTKSDSAATHSSSTQSVGGIILSLYACWEQAHTPFPLLITDVWDLNTGKSNGGVKREQAMKTGNFPQPTSAPRANGYSRDLSTHAHCKCTDFSNDSIFSNSFSLQKCAKDLSVLQIYLPVSDKDLFLSHCSTFHLHWLSLHRILDT